MPKVKIYTTPSCIYCRMAKEFFKENKVEYEEKDVAADATAREEMFSKSGQIGVPVIDVEGEFIVGFDEPRLREALGIK